MLLQPSPAWPRGPPPRRPQLLGCPRLPMQSCYGPPCPDPRVELGASLGEGGGRQIQAQLQGLRDILVFSSWFRQGRVGEHPLAQHCSTLGLALVPAHCLLPSPSQHHPQPHKRLGLEGMSEVASTVPIPTRAAPSCTILSKALWGWAPEPCKDTVPSLLGPVQHIASLPGSRSFLMSGLSFPSHSLMRSSCGSWVGQGSLLQGSAVGPNSERDVPQLGPHRKQGSPMPWCCRLSWP